MGGGSWTTKDWTVYTTTMGYTDRSTASDMYNSYGMKDAFNPLKITVRESCDSEEHPNSTPIILGLDVTGSMGHMLEIVSKRLGDTMTEIYARNPVDDPQIAFMAIGDTYYDDSPLQVTQFESDIRIAEQLNQIYFERGGGGNDGESYLQTWYFASRRCKTDAWDKHGKKGFIFTVGDEACLNTLPKEHIKQFLGDDVEADLSAEELLTEVSRKWEVYHLIVKPVSYQDPVGSWGRLLGENSLYVENADKIPEIIVSILELNKGKSVDDIVASWDGSTGMVVRKALGNLVARQNPDTGLIEF